jgi:hypothetical protein
MATTAAASSTERNAWTWTWTPPALLVPSIPSARGIALRRARARQAAVECEWRATHDAERARVDRLLADAPLASAAEQQAEESRHRTPLGRLLQPHTGLGQQRRSPRTLLPIEEQHAQLHARLIRAAAEAGEDVGTIAAVGSISR